MTDYSKSKSVLGKGLSSLIPRIPDRSEPMLPTPHHKDAGGDNVIVHIEISKISPNPFQPRMDFNQQSLDELKRSIIEKGIIQPITVRRLVNGTYELISGERRVRACQEAGVRTIPAYIIHVKSDAEMLELGLIENLQRENLNPIEIALSYQRLIEECTLTQEEVAQKVGKDRSSVTNFLRLLKLPEKIQLGVRENTVSMGHARALISAGDEKTQMKLFNKIITDGWSVRNVEQAVKGANGKPPKKTSTQSTSTRRTSAGFHSVETILRQSLGTKVSISKNANGSGEIVIEYYNPDDLDRLIELLEQ